MFVLYTSREEVKYKVLFEVLQGLKTKLVFFDLNLKFNSQLLLKSHTKNEVCRYVFFQ